MEQLERDFKANGGEFREFLLSELFEVKSSKKIFHANNIKDIYHREIENSYPYVVRSTINNGIRGYILQDAKFLNPGNTLSFAQDTFSVFYQEKPYFTGNKVKILAPKFNSNRKNLSYLVVCFQKALSDFSWGVGSTVSSIEKIRITLPCDSKGNIAFHYMESYIRELEALRLSELEAYLAATGLKDYELNQKDKDALAKFDRMTNGGGYDELGEFRIIDLFDVKNTHSILQSWIKPNSGCYPYVTASSSNNAVSSYINYDINKIEQGNSIMIGGKTLVVTYQPQDYFSNDSHNLALYIKNKKFQTRLNNLFCVCCLLKSLKPLYSWGNSISNKKIQNNIISLPYDKSGNPDFDFMQDFIAAIQKIVIKDVVLWNEEKIKATKVAIS